MNLRRIAPLFNENTDEKRPISMSLQPIALSPKTPSLENIALSIQLAFTLSGEKINAKKHCKCLKASSVPYACKEKVYPYPQKLGILN